VTIIYMRQGLEEVYTIALQSNLKQQWCHVVWPIFSTVSRNTAQEGKAKREQFRHLAHYSRWYTSLELV